MNSKILLLSIAVIAVGLFAMPTTLSLFSGQHTFDKMGNTTMCAKCHSDVVAEILAGNFHKSLITDTGTTECKACHTTSKVLANLMPRGNDSGNGSANISVGLNISTGNFTQANGTNITELVAHAAVTVECMACHPAVNFTNDAHYRYASDASNQTLWLKGANEACIGCHTKARVEMRWERKGGYNYTYDFQNRTGALSKNETNVTTHTNNTG